MPSYRAILSLHDVTPAWQHQISQALEWVERLGVGAPALLVVPDHHRRFELVADDPLSKLVRQQMQRGSTVILHGLYHLAPQRPVRRLGLRARLERRFLTANEGEFQLLDYDDSKARLVRGRQIVANALGIEARGFVAPAWLQNSGVARALGDLDFSFYEDHLWLYTTDGVRRFVPAVTFTGRSASRARLSAVWARLLARAPLKMDLRLALHPVDFDRPQLLSAIEGLVTRLRRSHRFVSYEQYLDKSTGC